MSHTVQTGYMNPTKHKNRNKNKTHTGMTNTTKGIYYHSVIAINGHHNSRFRLEIKMAQFWTRFTQLE
jgi:hypothetical protein